MNLTYACHPVLTRLFIGLMLPLALSPAMASARDGGETPSNSAALSHEVHTFLLEEEKVWVNIYEGRQPGFTFVNLHDNENTGAEAAKVYISNHGGRLVELVHGRGRTVVIRRNGILHHFDPNRMFTEDGLRRSLDYFHNLTEQNLAIAADFAREVADFIGIEKGKIVIAVHNNTPGKLTIRDFESGQWYGTDTRDVFVNPARDPDDFFFTNSPALFRGLKTMAHNVALMAVKSPDHGNLGNVVNRAGGVYILVEAEHGQLTRQIGMLEDLGRLLTGDSPAGN